MDNTSMSVPGYVRSGFAGAELGNGNIDSLRLAAAIKPN
jgi:hypothetical protein